MLTSVRRLVGMPVIYQQREMGYVEQAFVRKGEDRLDGVVIRRGIGSAKWLSAEEIASIRREGILAKGKPSEPARWLQSQTQKAYLPSGACVGEVSDWILLNGDLRFAALEVSAGPLYRLLGRCGYACEYHRDRQSDGVIVPRLLSWAQLKRQLGEEDDG